jgi:hypothetical protein
MVNNINARNKRHNVEVEYFLQVATPQHATRNIKVFLY